jgi:hypothetical protein
MMKSRLVGLVSAAALAVAGGAIGFSQVAFAGAVPVGPVAPLTVVKTVSGTVPAGTTFTATIQCDDDIIDTGDGSTDQATVTFDSTGQPTSADTVGFDDPGQCTVTESASGGAATTTYSCEGTVPDEPTKESDFSATQVAPIDEVVCEAAGPQAAPITVNIFDEGQTATVTIHNTFVAPTPPPPIPAAQVVAQPAFTG